MKCFLFIYWTSWNSHFRFKLTISSFLQYKFPSSIQFIIIISYSHQIMNKAYYNYQSSQLVQLLSFKRLCLLSLYFQQLSTRTQELFIEFSEQPKLIIFSPISAFTGIKIFFFSQTNKKCKLFLLVPPQILFGSCLVDNYLYVKTSSIFIFFRCRLFLSCI